MVSFLFGDTNLMSTIDWSRNAPGFSCKNLNIAAKYLKMASALLRRFEKIKIKLQIRKTIEKRQIAIVKTLIYKI